MARRSRTLAVLVAAVLAAAAVVVPATGAQAAPVNVMPLGDSITGGPGCWRALLWSRLQATGYTGVDFVGTLPGGGCGVPVWDGENEGHGGFQAVNVANERLLPGWLAATGPDVVMMHFGTNDIWNRRPTAEIITAFGTLVDQMRAANPAMKILVAQIIPVAPSGCPECRTATVDLNRAIAVWAAATTTAQSPIVVVDHWTGWDPAVDTFDGVHQTDAGNQKMADRWYPALTAALNGTTPTTTTDTTSTTSTTTTTRTRTTTTRTTTRVTTTTTGPTSTTTRSTGTTTTTTTTRPVTTTRVTSTTQPVGGCVATYRLVNSWSGGFQSEVTVLNRGPAALTGWTVRLTLAGGQLIQSLWNGLAVGAGGAVSVQNAPYNGSLGVGASTTFGFVANGDGALAPTAVSCTVS